MNEDLDKELVGVVFKGVLEKVVKLGFNTKRLCILSEKEFSYFPDQKGQGSPVKRIPLQDIQAVKRDHSSIKDYQFEIITQQRTLIFGAASLELLEHWIRIITLTALEARQGKYTHHTKKKHRYEDIDIDNAGKKEVTVKGNAYETVDVGDLCQPSPLVQSPAPQDGRYSFVSPIQSARTKSPTKGIPINAYETVDMDEHAPQIIEAKRGTVKSSHEPVQYSLAKAIPRERRSTPNPRRLNQYEEVDVVPNISQGKPDSAEKEVPIYATANTTKKNNAQNGAINQKSVNPQKPNQRGVCQTVDALGGPPLNLSTDMESRPPPRPPPDARNPIDANPSECLYSEVSSVKKSQLYLQCKEMKDNERPPPKTDGYSDAVDSHVYNVNNWMSPEDESSKMSECYADGISLKLSQYENTEEEIYEEAGSEQQQHVQSEDQEGNTSKANPNKNLNVNETDGTQPSLVNGDNSKVYPNGKIDRSENMSESEDHMEDVKAFLQNLPPITPTPSLKYGQITKHKAILDLKHHLQTEQSVSRFSFLSRKSSDETIEKLRQCLSES